jgi:hypothetical protein
MYLSIGQYLTFLVYRISGKSIIVLPVELSIAEDTGELDIFRTAGEIAFRNS